MDIAELISLFLGSQGSPSEQNRQYAQGKMMDVRGMPFPNSHPWTTPENNSDMMYGPASYTADQRRALVGNALAAMSFNPNEQPNYHWIFPNRQQPGALINSPHLPVEYRGRTTRDRAANILTDPLNRPHIPRK